MAASPGLAWTYDGGNAALLERALPLVDYIEVMPDAISRHRDGRLILDEARVAELEAIGPPTRIIVHGVGLSIGSHDGWSDSYVEILDELVDRLNPAWHSEHLAYTRVDGEFLGTMLSLPRTDETLAMVAARARLLIERYELPFLLENVVRLLPDHPADYSEAAFLNALARESGCGLLLDVYNLECDRRNNDLDVDAFLTELDLGLVGEVHVAGGVEHRGYQLDVHSRTVADSTIALAQRVLDGADGIRAVTYELLEVAWPVVGEEGLIGELTRLRHKLLARPVAA